MAGDPSPWIPWNDAIGYMPWLMQPCCCSQPMLLMDTFCSGIDCPSIGAPPHPLWFWDVALDVQEGKP